MSVKRVEITQERWENAYRHAKYMLKLYKNLGPAGMIGAMFIASQIHLYESGDRSTELLEVLEAIE